jgi:hypothetical protein
MQLSEGKCNRAWILALGQRKACLAQHFSVFSLSIALFVFGFIFLGKRLNCERRVRHTCRASQFVGTLLQVPLSPSDVARRAAAGRFGGGSL